MTFDIEQIKHANPIEDVIGKIYPLKKVGQYFQWKEHDSFVVAPAWQHYFWNSCGEHGDVVTFVQKHIVKNNDFMIAIEWLANNGNIGLEKRSPQDANQRSQLRILSQRLHHALLDSPEALVYAKSRGFNDEIIRAEHLGHMPCDKQALLKGLDALPKFWKQAIQDCPIC